MRRGTEDSDDEGDDESDSIDIDPFEAVLELSSTSHETIHD
jgi:hypothetical protein